MNPRAILLVLSLILIWQIESPTSVFASEVKSKTTSGAKSKYTRFDVIYRSKSPAVSFKLDEQHYQGKTIDSYPDWLLGNWGGRLKIHSFTQTPLVRKLDSDLAEKTSLHLQQGRQISLNFEFKKDSTGKIKLEPVHGVIMVPMQDSHAVNTVLNEKFSEAQRDLLSDVIKKNEIPVSISFGLFENTSESSGLTGGQVRSRILKTNVRKLEEKCFEEQIIDETVNKTKNATIKSQSESVLWFKQHPDDEHLFVRLANINCDQSGRLLDRLLVSGYLIKGKHVITDPRTILNQPFKR